MGVGIVRRRLENPPVLSDGVLMATQLGERPGPLTPCGHVAGIPAQRGLQHRCATGDPANAKEDVGTQMGEARQDCPSG